MTISADLVAKLPSLTDAERSYPNAISVLEVSAVDALAIINANRSDMGCEPLVSF